MHDEHRTRSNVNPHFQQHRDAFLEKATNEEQVAMLDRNVAAFRAEPLFVEALKTLADPRYLGEYRAMVDPDFDGRALLEAHREATGYDKPVGERIGHLRGIPAPTFNRCPHLAVRETSIGGTATDRECLDCGLQLPDRERD